MSYHFFVASLVRPTFRTLPSVLIRLHAIHRQNITRSLPSELNHCHIRQTPANYKQRKSPLLICLLVQRALTVFGISVREVMQTSWKNRKPIS